MLNELESIRATHLAAPNAEKTKAFVKLGWAMAISAAIVSTSVLSGFVYHWLIYGHAGNVFRQIEAGAIIALVYIVSSWRSSESTIGISTAIQHWKYQSSHWNIAFILLLIVSFASKVTGDLSRGAILFHYFLGFPIVVFVQTAWDRLLGWGLRSQLLTTNHILLIGTREAIASFERNACPGEHGIVVTNLRLPELTTGITARPADDPGLQNTLDRALRIIRHGGITEVVLLLPWSETETIDACIDTLGNAPASIYLGPERIVDRFPEIKVSRLAQSACLHLVRPPLNALEIFAKRAFDIVLASVALILAAPVLIAVAIAIKLDSKGPILFRQHRHGFNEKPFDILKFRSMTVCEDGRTFTQARPGDSRITRVGHIIRRWNFDELPQLLNVLKGDMSLVGPRPHALTHNRQFENRIARYAQRHHMKPGITGWAQVNGLRGVTDTDEKMAKRVEYDLFYLNHWSPWFDVFIIALTVLSPKAYRNAL